MINNKIILTNPIRQEKILIDGKAQLRDVYKININQLFYNDKNGRIASFVADYNANNTQSLSSLDRDVFNDTLMNFIKESGSKNKYKQTKEDIQINGQLKTGIILNDGRIIDGNRRFTCLRELYNETHNEKFLYFECFVFDVPITHQEQIMIKSLELKYQFGEDQKEDYNPIDRLVDIYNNLVGPEKLFTPEEYRDRVNNQMSLAAIKQSMDKASLMVDFLSFIDKPGRYDIARDLKLDGQLQEIAVFKKTIKDEKEWNNVYPALFQHMKISTGDRTRTIRPLIKLYKENPYVFEQTKRELLKIAMKEESFANNEEVKKTLEREKEIYKQNIVRETTKVNINVARRKQVDIVKHAYSKLSEINVFELQYLSDDLKSECLVYLNKIQNVIKKVEQEIR